MKRTMPQPRQHWCCRVLPTPWKAFYQKHCRLILGDALKYWVPVPDIWDLVVDMLEAQTDDPIPSYAPPIYLGTEHRFFSLALPPEVAVLLLAQKQSIDQLPYVLVFAQDRCLLRVRSSWLDLLGSNIHYLPDFVHFWKRVLTGPSTPCCACEHGCITSYELAAMQTIAGFCGVLARDASVARIYGMARLSQHFKFLRVASVLQTQCQYAYAHLWCDATRSALVQHLYPFSPRVRVAIAVLSLFCGVSCSVLLVLLFPGGRVNAVWYVLNHTFAATNLIMLISGMRVGDFWQGSNCVPSFLLFVSVFCAWITSSYGDDNAVTHSLLTCLVLNMLPHLSLRALFLLVKRAPFPWGLGCDHTPTSV